MCVYNRNTTGSGHVLPWLTRSPWHADWLDEASVVSLLHGWWEVGLQTLVVVVHGNAQHLLGSLLAHDVAVQEGGDLGSRGQVCACVCVSECVCVCMRACVCGALVCLNIVL